MSRKTRSIVFPHGLTVYSQEFFNLYCKNPTSLKDEIIDTLENIKDTYNITEYYLSWGWPFDEKNHLHLFIRVKKKEDRYPLIDKLDDLFPEGLKFVEVRPVKEDENKKDD